MEEFRLTSEQALFSMPIFNWQADSGTTVVSHRFWIYWAITVPLTIVVVLVWFIWIQRKDARHQREDLAVRQFDDSDPQMPKGPPAVDPGSDSTRSGRSSWAFPETLRRLVRTSKAALGLRVAREKQNLA